MTERAAQAELFELELFGQGIERRYRRLRPEVEAMPWGTLETVDYPEHVIIAARRAWTGAAFQEHRTGAACARTLRALIEARAPVDLIAIACRFPLDEMVHVELCSRIAMELGGGSELRYDPRTLSYEPASELSPLMRASELVVHNFCVGEALSIPLLRGSARAAAQPLTRAVLARIVRDEAAHGSFGWSYLDWAAELLTASERDQLALLAARSIRGILQSWSSLRVQLASEAPQAYALGWMQTRDYLSLAARSLEHSVLSPLANHGIHAAPYLRSVGDALSPSSGAIHANLSFGH